MAVSSNSLIWPSPNTSTSVDMNPVRMRRSVKLNHVSTSRKLNFYRDYILYYHNTLFDL